MPKHRRSLEASLRLTILVSAAAVLLSWAAASAFPALPAWLPWIAAAITVAMLAWSLPARILRPVASLVNVLEAVRGQDLSLRARTDRRGVVGDLAREINRLADGLHAHGLAIRQSDALLAKLMAEVDLPIFTFDRQDKLVAANPAAEHLCGTRLHAGANAHALGLGNLLEHRPDTPVELHMAGGAGRFLVRRRPFRIAGQPYTLLVLAEVGDALGAERREAWQSLVRVLGHEINNSLTPIKSISQTLLASDGQPAIEDVREGLDLIMSRADALQRFVGSYATLARMPAPTRDPIALKPLMVRVAELETRVTVELDGPETTVNADVDQLEQALINLVKNAGDAVADSDHGQVRLHWRSERSNLLIEIMDNGPGPPETDNLFVPFFTTKPGGSGVGLLLARRIAELHGGGLTLEARADGPGALARLWLPGNSHSM